MRIRVLAAAAAAFAVLSPAAHAATFMGTIKATCISACFDQAHTYQQTVAASSFSGAVSISAFSFDRALLGQDFQTSVFHVTFWTADGHQVGDFGRYMVGSLAGDTLTLKGQSFTYDPSLGNLTMRIELDGFSSGAGGGGYGFGAGGGGGYGFGASGGGAGAQAPGASDGGVVVDQISFAPPGVVAGPNVTGLGQPVPEPTSWVLMVLGFAGAGAVLRRRRLQPVCLQRPAER